MKKHKRYQEMTTAELREATREFDLEGTIDRAKPLTAAERAQERRLRAGRPRTGEGAQRINITVEKSLLRAADRLAKRQKIGRSELISRGLSALLKRPA